MNTFSRFFTAEFIYALGWTILHSFWQCALISVAIAITLRSAKKISSNMRYLIACSGLVLCFVISLLTFKSYWSIAQQARIDLLLDALNLQLNQMLNTQRAVQGWFSGMDGYLIWIVLTWLIGCVAMSIRNLLDFMLCLKLQKEGTELVSPHWENTVHDLCKKVGITRKVNVRISSYLQSPCTLGHFKPLILVPVGLLTSMSQAQVEVILMHELGHIRRNDYAIGLIQMLLKIIFFFNPMALWISSMIDAERENACDDIAVDVCKDPLFFSKTLKEFAELNSTKNLSMAINDNNMQLLNRIKRQLQRRKQLSRVVEKLVASFTLLLCCTTAAVYAQTNSPADGKKLKENIEVEMLKWPMFSKFPQDERLVAVKYYLEEFESEKFSADVVKTVSLENDKYPSEKIDAYFFNDSLKVKLDISVDMLKAMAKQDDFYAAKDNLILFKNGKNYIAVINNFGSEWTNKTLDDKLRLVSYAYSKSSLMNKFFAKNNLEEYKKPFLVTPADLTFKVTQEYLFVELSPKLIDYALNAPDADAQNLAYDYQKKSLVPGAPYAGAEKGIDGNMIITYDRKAWEEKSEWMNKNRGVKPAKSAWLEEGKKEIAESIGKLDDRRKNLLLTDDQLKKVKNCFELHHGFEMPDTFTYNMQKSWISHIAQLNDEQLIKMEEHNSARLKRFTMGGEDNSFYVNLLDDSDKTPEDPEGLANCKK